jgi:hypothetical protein
MFKKIGSIVATILGLLLLVYSASRSLDFIGLTLPADKQVLAWFGLAALDGGLIAWLIAYLHGAHGWQRPVALVMVIVDLAGAVAMFTLDTLYNTGTSGITQALSSDEIYTAVLALSAVIALNIAATVASHLLEPAALRQQAEEEARDKIEEEALRQIGDNAKSLAAELAPQIAADWVTRTRSSRLSGMATNALDTEQPQLVTRGRARNRS